MYPMLEINLKSLKENVIKVVNNCKERNITVAGVIKGVNGLDEVTKCFIDGGVSFIASSRVEQLKKVKEKYDINTMMIRIPMLSEAEEIIKYCDYSLNSELVVLEELNKKARELNKVHKVILMADLGDLREGYINLDELVETALNVEQNMSNLILSGIGVNLGCYGSIKPSVDNLSILSSTAERIEQLIGRKLEIISGGATTSYPLVLDGTIPNKVNNLRIGDGLLVNTLLPLLWNVDTSLNNDTFILKGEIIEKKLKPTYPIGEIFVDAFGNTPVYEDKGERLKVLVAIGKQDIGDIDKIIPIDKDLKIIGASSDHLIIDITDSKVRYNVGDIIEFNLFYQALLLSSESENVKKCLKY